MLVVFLDPIQIGTRARQRPGGIRWKPSGGISGETVARIVKTLTMSEIKSMAGLCNVSVVKGDENFARLML